VLASKGAPPPPPPFDDLKGTDGRAEFGHGIKKRWIGWLKKTPSLCWDSLIDGGEEGFWVPLI